MGNIGFVYKSSIALACLVLMFASIACTGWFFYSWLEGIPGIVGACVGCAVQIMAYGFSGVIVQHAKGILRFSLLILIASALSLSVLSSYATLTGYFTALQLDKQAKEMSSKQKEDAIQAALAKRMQLMESMSRDVEIGSEAADQGVSEKYRTQAKNFLSSNVATRNEMAAQIEKVESMIQSDLLAQTVPQSASPIDGLSYILGGQNTTVMILCIWLAIMFDALPIAGITLLEAKSKRRMAQLQAEAAMRSGVESLESDVAPEIFVTGAIADESTSPMMIEEAPKPKENFKILTNICAFDLQASKAFYVDLLDFEVKYDSDWYIQLCSNIDPDAELGLIQHNHELVPLEYQRPPRGMYLTFVVPDVDNAYRRALNIGAEVIQEPRNEFYGQRRFLVKEPSGCLVDICSPWEEEAQSKDAQTNEAQIDEVTAEEALA